MTKRERETLERLIPQLEDRDKVIGAMMLPFPGESKSHRKAYEAGAVMQANALAMVLRGIFAIPKETSDNRSDRSDR